MAEDKKKRFTLRKKEKLHSQNDFKRVLKMGRRVYHPALLICIHEGGEPPLRRIGLITKRKVGNAVKRNRVKRFLREIFRLNKYRLPEGTDVIFIPNESTKNYKYRELEAIVIAGLKKIKVLEDIS